MSGWEDLSPVVTGLLALPALTLSTCAESGPYATPLYFAALPGYRLTFFSDPKSLHSRHLAADPHAAAAIFPQDAQGWQSIRGLQMQGSARKATASEHPAALESYLRKFPFVVGLTRLTLKRSLYIYEVRWLRLVDNAQGFGHQQEWTFP